MAKVTFRTDEAKKEALEEIKDQWDISFTNACNDALRVWLGAHKEDLPDHLKKEITHEDIVKRNKPSMRAMRFKQRVHDTLRDLLEHKDGSPKKFPPSPAKVEENYIESLREGVREEYDQYEDEYMGFLDERMEWYRLQHPDEDVIDGKTYNDVVARVAEHIEQDNMEFAHDYIDRAKDMGTISHDTKPTTVIDDARQMMADEGWRDEWKESVGGNKA